MPSSTLSRRRVLGAAAKLAAAAAAACAGRSAPTPDPPPSPAFRLPPVRVSRDRVIRTVVGLRPYRPSGFRVEAQDLGGGRTLVHNYGHGGGGVTMSWGTAWLAVEELLGEGPPPARAAVIGCGAVGLATARLLQRRGVEVTIYTRDLPPDTTSNVACAQWSPFSVSDPRVHGTEFQTRFERAARIAYRIFQDMVGVRYGIGWLPNYPLSDVAFGGAVGPEALADLFPDARDLAPGTHPFPSRHARRFTSILTLSVWRQKSLIPGGLWIAGTLRGVTSVVSGTRRVRSSHQGRRRGRWCVGGRGRPSSRASAGGWRRRTG